MVLALYYSFLVNPLPSADTDSQHHRFEPVVAITFHHAYFSKAGGNCAAAEADILF